MKFWKSKFHFKYCLAEEHTVGNMNKYFSSNHDYIICYAKNKIEGEQKLVGKLIYLKEVKMQIQDIQTQITMLEKNGRQQIFQLVQQLKQIFMR